MTRYLLLGLLALLADGVCRAESLSGRVVSVHDGDTLTVLVDQERVRVHLAEIDAPELRQPFGRQSRQSLSDLCLGKAAAVAIVRREPGGGIVGQVRCASVDASAAQVERGMAWVYRRDANSSSPLYYLEDTAQRSRQGLWVDRSPAPPWQWRARNR